MVSGDTESAQKIIEERFASIETSVKFLEKEIDNIEVPDVTEIKTDIATIKADLQTLDRDIQKLEWLFVAKHINQSSINLPNLQSGIYILN